MINSKYTTFLGALTDTLLIMREEAGPVEHGVIDLSDAFVISVDTPVKPGRPVTYRVMGGSFGDVWEFTIQSNGRNGWRVDRTPDIP